MAKQKNFLTSNWGMTLVMILPIIFYMWLVSFLVPMMVDDFFPASHNTQGDFFNWSLIWAEFKNSYFTMTGRVGMIFWSFLLLSFGRMPFNQDPANFILAGINAVVFVGFLWSVYMLAFARRPNFQNARDRFNWVILFLLSMTILARKGDTIFYISGYVTYSWAMATIFAFGVFYRLAWADKTIFRFKKNSWQEIGFIVFIALFGFLAGMSYEIGGILALTLLLLGFIYKLFVVREKLPRWCYIGLIGFILGYIVLMTAPGNYIRLSDSYFDKFHQLSFVDKLLRIPHMERLFLTRLRWVTPFIAIAIIYIWQKNIKVSDKKLFGSKTSGWVKWLQTLIQKMVKQELFGIAILMMLAGVAGAAAIAFSPVKEGRVFFSATCFFMVGFLITIDYLWASKTLSYRAKRVLAAILLLLMLFELNRVAWHAYEYRVAYAAREADIKAQKEKGVMDIIVPSMNLKTKMWFGNGDIEVDWLAKYWGDFYGVNSIRTPKKETNETTAK